MNAQASVAVIGAGSWGTTVAAIVSAHAPTVLWGRNPAIVDDITSAHENRTYLPGIALPEALRATTDLAAACAAANVVVMAVPSHGFRAVLSDAVDVIEPDTPIVSLSKGVEADTQFRMTQVMLDVLPGHRADRVAVLTGPNLAREVAEGQPAASVIACRDATLSVDLQELFMSATFRVYTNPDIVGCEIAGALKNVIAIAAGISAGLGYGDNTQAGLITRGLAELTRLGVALGGEPLTFAGLAGLGDLVATCVSEHSRNRSVGVELGRGRRLDEIVTEMNMVAEGVRTTAAVLELAADAQRGDADRRDGRCRPLRGSPPGRSRPRADAATGEGRAARPRVTESLPRASMVTAGANGRRQLVGVLGGGRAAAVDDRGTVAPERAGWQLGWWIGADDRWHDPATDAAVRQSRVDDMPVFRTAMRVPGGDAVQHVYGARDLAVVEITNDSPAPFVVALVVHGAARLGLEDRVIGVDGRPAVITARGPSRWAAELDGSTEQVVMSGQAHEGPFRPVTSRAARLTAAFLYPVAHRTTFRAAVGLSPSGLRVDDLDLDVASLPAPAAAARGWRAQLDRALRVELPDPVLQHSVDAARADVLLAGQAWMPDPMVVAALEDWGFDDESARGVAAAPWSRASPAGQAHAANGRLGGSCRAGAGRWRAAAGGCARGTGRRVGCRGRAAPHVAGVVAWAAGRRAGRADEAWSRVVLGAMAR